jgi:chaperonin cofactor prefoldin
MIFKDSVGKEIHSSEIGRKIDTLRKRQIELDSQISSVENEISSCKKDMGKIEERKILDSIQKSLSSCLKKNIVIIN